MGTKITEMPVEVAQGELETRYVELGDMLIRHVRVPAGTDFGPVLKGLPDDRCPSPHWGIVLEGSLRMEHADGGAVFLEVGPVAPMHDFHDHALRVFG